MGVVSLVVRESAGNGGPAAPRAPVSHLRSQLAVVRALADQVDCVSEGGEDGGLRDQLIEELARLGCRLLEEADSLARR